jgi:hypothetical protein
VAKLLKGRRLFQNLRLGSHGPGGDLPPGAAELFQSDRNEGRCRIVDIMTAHAVIRFSRLPSFQKESIDDH